MIENVSSNLQTYNFSPARKTESISGSFDNALSEAQNRLSDEHILMKNAPEKWVTEAEYSADAVEIAEKFLRDELGIDASKIEPTHEISPEQTEWLKSRHDFSSMSRYEMYSFVNDSGQTQYGFKYTPEFSNFLGDLMYLGIFSKQELKVDLWVEPIDTRPGGYSSVISTNLSEYMGGSAFDFTRAAVSNLENMWNFYNERSKGIFAVDGDSEFAELIKEHFLPLQKQFLELIEKLFKNDDDTPQNIVNPHIEDISEKLKEDFGELI